jgi:hypothetical protein
MTNRPNEDELGTHYRAAMEEWHASEDAELWESTIGDGLDHEPEWPELPPASDDESGGAERRRLLRVLEDVVGADPTPNDVRFAFDLFFAVPPGRATVGGPRHFIDSVATLDALDAQSWTRLSLRPEIFHELPHSLAEAGALLGREFRVVVLELRKRFMRRRHFGGYRRSRSSSISSMS